MDELNRRVQDLPSELFNYIFELTLTADPVTQRIDSSYKPRSLLSVSSHTRGVFMASWHSMTVFEFDDRKLLRKWIDAFEGYGLHAMMKEVHLSSSPTSSKKLTARKWARMTFPRLNLPQGHVTCFEEENGWVYVWKPGPRRLRANLK